MASKHKTIVTGNDLELDVKNNIGDFNKIIGNTTQEASPNPDYPSKVETVGSNINLLNLQNGTKEHNGITVKTNNGIINSNGTASSNSFNTIYLEEPITLKANQTYVLSANNENTIGAANTSSNYASLRLQYNSTAINNTDAILGNKNASKSFTFTEDTLVDSIVVRTGQGLTMNNFIIKPKLEQSKTSSPYSPYGKGSVEVKVSNKNLFTTANQILAYIGGSSFVLGDSSTSNDNYTAIIPIKPNTSYTISRSIISSRFRAGFYSTKNALGQTLRNGRTSDSATNMTVTSGENDYYLYLYYWTQNDTTPAEEIASTIQVEEGTTITDYIQPKQQTYLLYLPFELCKIGDYKDYIFKENNKWYKHKEIGKIIFNGSEDWRRNTATIDNVQYSQYYMQFNKTSTAVGLSNYFLYGKIAEGDNRFNFNIAGSLIVVMRPKYNGSHISTIEEFKTWLSNNNTTVYYVLETPIDEEITDTTLIRQLNELENILLYNGINYISMEGNGTFEFQYGSKFDFYLSENNYLILNDTNKYLCSISESEIPDMPEAVDTTAKIAGRDGDIVLSTTYNPIPFNLVIYTEDNLSLQEKEEQKRIINQFWHEMKKQKKIFELESSQMFYEVKYNGLLECENHPKHLRFSLPFKSSRPYAYANEQKEMVGNSSVNSDTIEPVGFECVIKGPANNPIIYFNNYEMKYNNIVPENSKLVIDTKNSTIVLKNALGVETNAMRHYNHQFPKIQRGINTLKVQSGIADESQVTIEWYDLKF